MQITASSYNGSNLILTIPPALPCLPCAATVTTPLAGAAGGDDDLPEAALGGAGGLGGTGANAPTERPYSAYMLLYDRRTSPACLEHLPVPWGSNPCQVTPGSTSSSTVAPAGVQLDGSAAPGVRGSVAGGDAPAPMAVDSQQAGGYNNPQASFHLQGRPGTTPYCMPEAVYRHVLYSNLRLMFVAGIHDKEYFTFMRGVGGGWGGGLGEWVGGDPCIKYGTGVCIIPGCQ
jgi:hypothetical protein